MITPFDSTQLATLDSGAVLSDKINSRDVLKGIEIENFTPAFFEIVDDNNVVQVSIPPWSMKTSDLPKSQNFTLRTVSNAPVLTTNTVPDSAYRFGFLTYNYNIGVSTQALLSLAVIASGLVTVNNDVTNPVNTQPIAGTPTASQYIGLTTTYQTVLTLNAVCQRLMISTNNSSSTTALDSRTAYLVQISNNGQTSSSNLLWTFNVGSIPAMPSGLVTSGPFFEIDLSPGVYVGQVLALVNYIASGSDDNP